MCHGADLIRQQRLSREGWTREVDKMVAWGAEVDQGEKSRLVDYLTAQFGPPGAASLPLSDRADPIGLRLVETRCLTCHDRRLIDQQRLTAAGWTRVLDKMIGWGASVEAGEATTLVNHLAASLGR